MTTNKIESLLIHIGKELTLLWAQMDVWQELFDIEQEKRQALIQSTAPGFFAIVQVSLAEAILMRICRLMDPPKTGKQENSSLRSLDNELLSNPSHGSLHRVICTLVEEWLKKDKQTTDEAGRYAGLKTLRNKHLAHNDTKNKLLQSPFELGIQLTHADFILAQELARQLWEIYRLAYAQDKNIPKGEPQPSNLAGRPSQVLKELCASRYLSNKLQFMEDTQQRIFYQEELWAFEKTHMGADGISKVFTSNNTA